MTDTFSAQTLPAIDCVIIGVNAAATLCPCIESIKTAGYPTDLLRIIYVDGGSTDQSAAIARSMDGVEVIELDLDHPTPGLGRNAGWQHGNAELVQFLDSDTEVDPGWFDCGVRAFKEDIAAVQGYRTEKYPHKNVYHWITSLEWNGRPGEAESFGGDVLIRRSALEDTGGYDPVLVGGEDPELSRQIRLIGWKILQLDVPMTRHDIDMTSGLQYWKRAYRSGYAFAAVTDRFKNQPGDFWKTEYRRILVRGGGAFALTLAGLFLIAAAGLEKLSPTWPGPVLMTAALILLFFPRLFRVSAFMRDMQLPVSQAKVYAWHCSLVILPDFFGVLRFYVGKLLHRPLRNRSRKLATRGNLQ